MTRQAYIDRDRNLLIFWSPKCACSAIVKWWYHNIVGETLAAKGLPLSLERRWLHQHGYQVPYTAFKRIDFGQFLKIAVCRHPFDRAVSGYIDKFVGRNKRKVDRYETLDGFAADFWRDVRGVSPEDAPARYDGLSFLEFLRAIETRIAERGEGEPVLNPHWNTQAPFSLNGATYDRICDVSDLEEVFADLNARFGFSHLPPVIRTTDYGDFDGAALWDVSSLDLARSARPLNRENFRSPETEAIIRNAYDIDFRTFGYDSMKAKSLTHRVPRRRVDAPLRPRRRQKAVAGTG